MTGRIVPHVLVPQFSTFVGDDVFTTLPFDALMYSKGNVELWRGPLKGTMSPTFTFLIETSNDKSVWVPNLVGGYDPGANASESITFDIDRRWLRAKVVVTGTDPAVTCWCVGSLTERVR